MKTKIFKYLSLILLFTAVLPTCIFGQAAATKPVPVINAGNTAWMMIATALVLFMTIPGLALFYGGLVRQKNVLNIFMQCFIIMAVISLEWVMFGYSNAFGSSSGVLAPYIGGFHWAFLHDINITDPSPYFISQPIERIPHIVFIMFQCMFAVITPALIIGAFAERIKFKGFLVFTILWAIFVYNPVAHWVWSADGWLYKLGALDFAGGTVVHINAGIAAIVTAVMIGKRKYYDNHPTPPHNVTMVAIGAAMLWFGWFGFNGGSGLAADGLAGNAFLVTHIATATAALTWALIDWILNKKPTLVGTATGAVAGLVAITPAAGAVGIGGAMAIGVLVSIICFIMVSVVKHKWSYDDSLDSFGVHGVGGILGAILTGVFATKTVTSLYLPHDGVEGAWYGNFHQLFIQLAAVGSTIVYSGILTYLIFKLTDKFVGIRANEEEEISGLDITQHNEIAYNETE